MWTDVQEHGQTHVWTDVQNMHRYTCGQTCRNVDRHTWTDMQECGQTHTWTDMQEPVQGQVQKIAAVGGLAGTDNGRQYEHSLSV